MKHHFTLKLPELSLTGFFRRYKSGVIVLCVAVGTCMTLLYVDSLFRLRQVYIQSSRPVKVQTLTKQSLLFISTQEMERLIRRANPLIRTMEIRTQLPDTVHITVKWYQPIAAIAVRDGFIVVSKEGNVVEKTTDKPVHLPIIKYYQHIPFSQLSAGERVGGADIHTALYFLALLVKKNISVQRVDIQGFYMIGLYSSDQEFLLSAEKDRKIQEYHLEETIQLLRKSGKKASKIDVRFDKPVVVL